MLENIIKFLTNIVKKEKPSSNSNTKDTAKERLHLVLMQDRANVSADFLELMKQEIIEVIKKYIEIDEKAIDVRLTNKENSDGTNGAPTLYANIPIVNIKDETRKLAKTNTENKIQKNEEIIEKENNIQDNTKNQCEKKEDNIQTGNNNEKNYQKENINEVSQKENMNEVSQKENMNVSNQKESMNGSTNNKQENINQSVKNQKENTNKNTVNGKENKYNYKNKKSNNTTQKQGYNNA